MTIKNNIKLIMGVSSTWIKKDKQTNTVEEITQPVKTKTTTVYSKDELNRAIQ